MITKVFIPAAGLGSRSSKQVNLSKALININHMPVLSHIINQIPNHIEIVIGLGYEKEKIKEYLSLAHTDRYITTFDVSDFSSNKSGLGLTILEAIKYLQCPFVLWACDTISSYIPPNTNWVGASNKIVDEIQEYRTLELSSHKTIIRDKGYDKGPIYIGMAGIADYITFWHLVEENKDNPNFIRCGESFILPLMNQLSYHILDWNDTGNKLAIQYAKKTLEVNNEIHILPKDDEDIWFVNNKVIKYCDDKDFISNRITRANYLSEFVPHVTKYSKHMYSYDMVPGTIMSSINDIDIWNKLFSLLFNNFWINNNVNINKECEDFYINKTLKRTNQFLKKYSDINNINNRIYPSVTSILEKLFEQYGNILKSGQSTRFHGDLHSENILYNNGKFIFLDWRQDFGGNLNNGDIYYDFGKLNHGLIVSHKLIHQNNYTLSDSNNNVSFDFKIDYSMTIIKDILRQNIKNAGYDYRKVELISSLI